MKKELNALEETFKEENVFTEKTLEEWAKEDKELIEKISELKGINADSKISKKDFNEYKDKLKTTDNQNNPPENSSKEEPEAETIEEAEISFSTTEENDDNEDDKTADWRDEEERKDKEYAESISKEYEHTRTEEGLIAILKEKDGTEIAKFEHESQTKLKVAMNAKNEKAVEALSKKLDNAIEAGLSAVNLHGDINSELNQAIIKLAEQKGMKTMFEGQEIQKNPENKTEAEKTKKEELNERIEKIRGRKGLENEKKDILNKIDKLRNSPRFGEDGINATPENRGKGSELPEGIKQSKRMKKGEFER